MRQPTSYTVTVNDPISGRVTVEVSPEVWELCVAEEKRWNWREESRFRRHGNYHSLEDLAEWNDPILGGDPLEDLIIHRDTVRLLNEFLCRRCSPTQRKRFVLFFFAGYNMSEIARREHVTSKSIANSIEQVLKKLRANIDMIF